MVLLVSFDTIILLSSYSSSSTTTTSRVVVTMYILDISTRVIVR